MGLTCMRAIPVAVCSIAAALLLAVAGLAFNAGVAQAIYTQMEVDMPMPGTKYVMLDKAPKSLGADPNEWSIYDPSYSSKMTKAKSSNPKVVKVAHPSKNGFTLLMKKPGKATVTYKFKAKTPPFKIAKSHTQITVLWENKKGAVIASNLLP